MILLVIQLTIENSVILDYYGAHIARYYSDASPSRGLIQNGDLYFIFHRIFSITKKGAN